MHKDVIWALSAAALFGASTPFAKLLTADRSPVLVAGLLYLGSGLGLSVARLIRDGGLKPSGLPKAEWPWLLGAVFFGGVLGPVALMLGLVSTSGATASLLLNLESVLTAAIAWVVFKENANRRILLGMLAIVLGGVALQWQRNAAAPSTAIGPALVCLACLCWAVDNNLTRKVSASDALFIAGIKGLIAGAVNTALAVYAGATLPSVLVIATTMSIGLLGYGVSLVLFVLALRGLGTARTGAYFATAPFIGAALSLLVLPESVAPAFWVAAALMAAGIWLHLTEHHAHTHSHEALVHDHVHDHAHDHDDHHQHTHQHLHEAGLRDGERHRHPHEHGALKHRHPHYPDIHHRHEH